MSIREYLKTALIALRLNVLRSVLTTLGIIIGVASVIVMSAIGSGASKQIEDQIASLGTNQLTIFPGSQNVGGRQGGFGSAPPLTEKDVRAIREKVTGVVAVCRQPRGQHQRRRRQRELGDPRERRQRRDRAGARLAGRDGTFLRCGGGRPRARSWSCSVRPLRVNCSAVPIRSARRCA